MVISGWGNYNKIDSNVFYPKSLDECKFFLDKNSLIPRGNGRSYGDSSVFKHTLITEKLNKIINFDRVNGILECESGVKLNQILDFVVPIGWFLPVTPGSKFITIGGALASDVHGKNHHKEGSFSDHVLSFKILSGDNKLYTVTRNNPDDLFRATCGGMGLTGIIMSVKFKLKKIKSSRILEKKFKLDTLEKIIEKFEEYKNSSYSVAWLDISENLKNTGRGIFVTGEHFNDLKFKKVNSRNFNIPTMFPSLFLNNKTSTMFNNIYYNFHRTTHENLIDYDTFFYPLDKINNWNRIYGSLGFLQHQFVIPYDNGILNLKKILNLIYENNLKPYLAVLKLFGKGNSNYLSFPFEGYSLALDFKATSENIKSIYILDKLIQDLGGKLYLTKDAIMKKSFFESSYKNIDKFINVRKKYNCEKKFISNQSLRLGL